MDQKTCDSCKNLFRDQNSCRLHGNLGKDPFAMYEKPASPGYAICDSWNKDQLISPVGIYKIFPRAVTPDPYWEYQLEIPGIPVHPDEKFRTRLVGLLEYDSPYRPEAGIVAQLIRVFKNGIPIDQEEFNKASKKAQLFIIIALGESMTKEAEEFLSQYLADGKLYLDSPAYLKRPELINRAVAQLFLLKMISKRASIECIQVFPDTIYLLCESEIWNKNTMSTRYFSADAK